MKWTFHKSDHLIITFSLALSFCSVKLNCSSVSLHCWYFLLRIRNSSCIVSDLFFSIWNFFSSFWSFSSADLALPSDASELSCLNFYFISIIELQKIAQEKIFAIVKIWRRNVKKIGFSISCYFSSFWALVSVLKLFRSLSGLLQLFRRLSV